MSSHGIALFDSLPNVVRSLAQSSDLRPRVVLERGHALHHSLLLHADFLQFHENVVETFLLVPAQWARHHVGRSSQSNGLPVLEHLLLFLLLLLLLFVGLDHSGGLLWRGDL